MWSSSLRAPLLAGAVAALTLSTRDAHAQQQAQGFAVDRLYLSAPDGGWFVMDTLGIRGGLGGVMALTTEYAHDPLRVRSSDGAQRVTVVSDEALANFGFAATYDRFRLYLNLDMPLAIGGEGGTVGTYQFTAPNPGTPFTPAGVNPSTAPDTLADARIGFDARLVGSARSAFRLGAGAQIFVPSPNESRAEYLTDDSFRAMGRVLFAGDVGLFGYAGHVGVHVRPLDDSPTPGSPQGSELLFGVAGGPRWSVGQSGAMALVLGPEIFGETALRSPFALHATGLEGLLTGRLEGTADDGAQVRVRLGAGAGIDAFFGTPQWRMVLGVELFDHHADRDHDGVSDSKDACPEMPGTRSTDPKANGCPVDSGATP
jgi:hypothetical protein